MLQMSVASAIEHEDQRYGRQLATTFEKAAIQLRIQFGGQSLLAVRKRKKTPGPLVGQVGRMKVEPTQEQIDSLL